jgi:membrane associated rhomboid family serine protease
MDSIDSDSDSVNDSVTGESTRPAPVETDLAGAPGGPRFAKIPTTRRRRDADEWALVLAAEGFEPTIIRCQEGFRVEVAPERMPDALRILAAWQQEREERAQRVRLPPVRSASTLEVATAYAMALSLLSFHLGLEYSNRYDALLRAGANRANLVLDGEFWRLVTSLTLHSDLPHVLGNTFFGGFFLAAVAGRLGIGLGVLAFVLTGTLGNLANDLYYGWDHSSIGASTGVFGLVGMLTGLAAWRRHQIAGTGRGGWVAFAAGLGIVAMIGTGGPKVDVSAHVFGLVIGGLTGLVLAIPLATRPLPGRSGQLLAFAIGCALILAAWQFPILDPGATPTD